MYGDLWAKVDVRVLAGVAAVLGIIVRMRVGKKRHRDTGHPWIQETVARRSMEFREVYGTDDPVDLMSTELGVADMDEYI